MNETLACQDLHENLQSRPRRLGDAIRRDGAAGAPCDALATEMTEEEMRAVRVGELKPLTGKIVIAGGRGVARAGPTWFHTGVPVDCNMVSLQDAEACWTAPARALEAQPEDAPADPPGLRVAEALTAELSGSLPVIGQAVAPPAGPAAEAEAPETPNLSPIGSSYPQGSGQDLRAISAGAIYQRSFPASDAGAAQLSVGVLPQGTELRGVPAGAELIASGSLATGGGGGGAVGAHGWLSPGRLNLALYVVGGAVAGQSPPEHTGANGVLQGSAGLEYVIGESRDTPRMTLGGAVLAGVQGRAQLGDPDDASTYIAHATTIGAIVNANVPLRYGAPDSPTAGIPRFAVWGELSPSRTSGGTTTAPPVSPGGPTMVRPTGQSSSIGGAAGLTVNLSLTASGLQVLSLGAFGGLHRQWDTVGGATSGSTQAQVGGGLGYAGRF